MEYLIPEYQLYLPCHRRIKLRNDLTELQGAIRLALENTKTILEQVNIICGQINAIFQMVDGVIPL